MDRRTGIKSMLGTIAIGAVLPECIAQGKLKGNINHSVARWCYRDIPLDELCVAVKKMGGSSVELVGPDEWHILKKHGLTCALPWGAGMGIEKGFNDPKLHDELVASYEDIFPKLQAAGLDKVICFSGNRNGKTDEEGLQNCVTGLKRLLPSAKKYGVTLVMELLNSKVNHKDYQCDFSSWGVELCKRLDSENFGLLYDIYHMQIMEGDVIATIRKHHKHFVHYHTGGVPGRAEIDQTQELNYPAIMKAIVATGYKGFVGQEFVPSTPEPLVSLQKAIEICDV